MRLARKNLGSKQHYLNNEDFWNALKHFKDSGIERLSEHEEGNYIGECIVKICKNLAKASNFNGYTYIDVMISEAIESCLKNVKSFDPYRSKYCFTYFTKIAYQAFIRRIATEKKEQILRYKMMSDSVILNSILQNKFHTYSEIDVQPMIDDIHIFLQDGEKLVATEKERKQQQKKYQQKPRHISPVKQNISLLEFI